MTPARYEIAVPRAAEPLRNHLPMGDERVGVTSRWIEIDGEPVIPVSAEVHYSRVPPQLWRTVLQRTRAGGATHVSTYAIWNHHEPVLGELRFDGELDLRRFLAIARDVGLGIVLRIGPYAHAEARRGGLPDWLFDEPLTPRSNDPRYLAHAQRWFESIARHIHGIPLFALQIENELYDDAAHLLTLKRLAQSVGFDSPLWTGTGWGGANLPADEFLPTFAGYSQAFWTEANTAFDAASASNFYLSDERDEVGVGADTRDTAVTPSNLDLSRYPYATCELGGGMVSAYHRRINASADEVAALALAKLASGSVWQGYYVYADGRNSRPGIQESHASGGRNDFPDLAYDFGAPLAVDGSRRKSWALLRRQHAFLAAFGSRLARMPAQFPQDAPRLPDSTGLRWSVRSDGESGFLFVVNYQPGVELPEHSAVSFHVHFDAGTIEVPPLSIPAGSAFVWPLRLAVGEAVLTWATAQPITVADWRGLPLLVLSAIPGMEPLMSWANGDIERIELQGPGDWFEVSLEGRVVARVLILEDSDALRLETGEFLALTGEETWALGSSGWEPSIVPRHPAVAVATSLERAGSTGAMPTRSAFGRASIPENWSIAAVWQLSWGEHVAPETEWSVVVDWEGDVARAFVGDRLVSDALFNGREWRIPFVDLDGNGALRIEILPLAEEADVYCDVRPPAGVAQILGARLESTL